MIAAGRRIVAGVDEAGRGPLAGPVLAAAVVLGKDFRLPGLTDSKKLSAKKRVTLARLIKQQAICWGIGRAEVEEIDRINIFQASLLAMRRAVEQLVPGPDLALIDGKWAPPLACASKTIIQGDLSEPAISAASILAKVTRDREMGRLHKRYPDYGFDAHKGYATRRHLLALTRLGACAIHRRSFLPVQTAIQAQLRFDIE